MATTNKFVIEYGLKVGTADVIDSSGKLAAAALSTLDSDDLSEGSTKPLIMWRLTEAQSNGRRKEF